MILNRPVGGGRVDVVVAPPGEEYETRLEHHKKVWVSIENWEIALQRLAQTRIELMIS